MSRATVGGLERNRSIGEEEEKEEEKKEEEQEAGGCRVRSLSWPFVRQ